MLRGTFHTLTLAELRPFFIRQSTELGQNMRRARDKRAAQCVSEREHAAAMRRLRAEERERLRTGFKWTRIRIAAPKAKAAPQAKETGITRHTQAVRALPIYRQPIVDRDGRRGIVLAIEYDAARAHRFGIVGRRITYITDPESIEWHDGIAQTRSNMGADLGEILACGAALETISRTARRNAKLGQNMILQCAAELDQKGRIALLERVEEHFRMLGIPYFLALHKPDPDGDQRNFHIHIWTIFRPLHRVGPYDFAIADQLRTDLDGPDALRELRRDCAWMMTETVRAQGHRVTFTHLSNAARGLPQKPLSRLAPTDVTRWRAGLPVPKIARYASQVRANEALVRRIMSRPLRDLAPAAASRRIIPLEPLQGERMADVRFPEPRAIGDGPIRLAEPPTARDTAISVPSAPIMARATITKQDALGQPLTRQLRTPAAVEMPPAITGRLTIVRHDHEPSADRSKVGLPPVIRSRDVINRQSVGITPRPVVTSPRMSSSALGSAPIAVPPSPARVLISASAPQGRSEQIVSITVAPPTSRPMPVPALTKPRKIFDQIRHEQIKVRIADLERAIDHAVSDAPVVPAPMAQLSPSPGIRDATEPHQRPAPHVVASSLLTLEQAEREVREGKAWVFFMDGAFHLAPLATQDTYEISVGPEQRDRAHALDAKGERMVDRAVKACEHNYLRLDSKGRLAGTANVSAQFVAYAQRLLDDEIFQSRLRAKVTRPVNLQRSVNSRRTARRRAPPGSQRKLVWVCHLKNSHRCHDRRWRWRAKGFCATAR
jgi:hypothetical protein